MNPTTQQPKVVTERVKQYTPPVTQAAQQHVTASMNEGRSCRATQRSSQHDRHHQQQQGSSACWDSIGRSTRCKTGGSCTRLLSTAFASSTKSHIAAPHIEHHNPRASRSPARDHRSAVTVCMLASCPRGIWAPPGAGTSSLPRASELPRNSGA